MPPRGLKNRKARAKRSTRLGLGTKTTVVGAMRAAMRRDRFIRGTTNDQLAVVNTSASAGATINFASGTFITLTCASGAPGVNVFTAGLAFTLADLGGYTEFTALFDQYRLERVRVRLVPMANMNNTTLPGTVTPGVGGFITGVIDLDDAGAPTAGGPGVLLQYESAQSCSALEECVFVLQPHVAVAAYASGVFTSYANERPWIDAASATVEHYGVKLLWEIENPYSGASILYYRMFLEYEVALRSVH